MYWIGQGGVFEHAVLPAILVIVFVETGLVIMPFLPGDSLLFAIGAIGSHLEGFDYKIASLLLIVAALCGDNLNY